MTHTHTRATLDDSLCCHPTPAVSILPNTIRIHNTSYQYQSNPPNMNYPISDTAILTNYTSSCKQSKTLSILTSTFLQTKFFITLVAFAIFSVHMPYFLFRNIQPNQQTLLVIFLLLFNATVSIFLISPFCHNLLVIKKNLFRISFSF